MKRNYSSPDLEFVEFPETNVMYTSTICSTPDTEYYEGVNDYADDFCFACGICDCECVGTVD